MDTIVEFHERDELRKRLNVSFIVIIPKREGTRSIKDYRPISLLGRIYNIISKVLSIILKKELDETVSTSQNVFVEGR